MRAKLTQAAIVCALVCAIGGHWAILQSVAWVGMAVNYSHNSTLREALVKTFNGKNPCTLCKVVQEGKKSEKEQAVLKVETKLDFWLARNLVLLYPPPPFDNLISEAATAQLRAESPPAPPPRAA
jgi:hypothetical protein